MYCDKYYTMGKQHTFIDSPEWTQIVDNIKGIMVSNGTMSTLLDFERVLDEADLYAFKNWKFGELVDGPVVKRYDVSATFMWPITLMPDPRGAKRLLPLGCEIKFKKTKMKVPVQIKDSNDFQSGTHYPKLIEREIWLVNITMPKQVMSDIREGSIEIAGESIDLSDLDAAYENDYDTEDLKTEEEQENMLGGAGPMGSPMPGSMPAPPIG